MILLTRKEVSESYPLSESYLAKMAQSSKYRRPGLDIGPNFHRIGKRVYYSPEDVESWIRSKRTSHEVVDIVRPVRKHIRKNASI